MIKQNRTCICFLANAGSVHTQRWAKHFANKGYQVIVISFQPGEIEGVTVIQLPLVSLHFQINILLNLLKIRRLVREIEPDILHAHYATSYGLAGALTGRHPYIVTAWGSDVLIMPARSWIYRKIVRYALRAADIVTSMAPHMTRHMIFEKLCRAEKIVTLPFGTDTSLFNPSSRKSGDTEDSPVIVSNRRLDAGMNVDLFVRAIPAVIKVFPDARFIVASDGTERPTIQKLTLELGVEANVEFRGHVLPSQMPMLLGNADIFVSTSPSDGNNISLCEAMACGAFPIATDISANQDWITTGVNGFLFPVRDHNELARCIIESLKKPTWRRSVQAGNYNIILDKGSWDKNMEIMTFEYEKILRKS
jgi:glycosyltransferase involved in cell wall biosynthesis